MIVRLEYLKKRMTYHQELLEMEMVEIKEVIKNWNDTKRTREIIRDSRNTVDIR